MDPINSWDKKKNSHPLRPTQLFGSIELKISFQWTLKHRVIFQKIKKLLKKYVK